MRERREYLRTDGLVLVNYRVAQLNLEDKSSAYDISAKGVRLIVDKKLECATAIEMEIYLPGDSQPVLAKGEIIWSQKAKEKEYFYAGIKFTSIDKNSKNKIIHYVQRKIHQPLR